MVRDSLWEGVTWELKWPGKGKPRGRAFQAEGAANAKSWAQKPVWFLQRVSEGPLGWCRERAGSGREVKLERLVGPDPRAPLYLEAMGSH